MRPNDRKYLKSHEWCKIENGIATIGITDHAVAHLSDLVFLDLPNKGASVTVGESFGEIESVKAVSELYLPVSGTITEVNTTLADTPEVVNSDPHDAGWMIRITLSDSGQLAGLMRADAYEAYVREEGGE